jgi:hypothetical protein
MNAPRAGRERLKSLVGPRLTVFGRCLSRGLPWPRWGNLRRAEVQMPSYTERFGADVYESHSVDIDPRFHATYTCDLAGAADARR